MQIAPLLLLLACAAATSAAPAPQEYYPGEEYDPYSGDGEYYGPDGEYYGEGGEGYYPSYDGESYDDGNYPGPSGFPDRGWFKHGLYADHGADWDDTYSGREGAHVRGFIEDRLSEAASFLADQHDDSFDFEEWYDEQLEEFKYDIEDVGYSNSHEKKETMDEFKDRLDRIAYDFAYSQGNDYADYVADTVSQFWDKATDEASDIIRRLREKGQHLTQIEHDQQELYWILIKLGCGDPHDNDNSYLPDEPETYPDDAGTYEYYDQNNGHIVRLELIDPTPVNEDLEDQLEACVPSDVVIDSLDPCWYAGQVGPDDPQCKLSQIWFELVEIRQELNEDEMGTYTGGHLTNKREHYLEDREEDLKREFSAITRKWRKLRHELDNLKEEEKHNVREIQKLNNLLAKILSVNTHYGPVAGAPIYAAGDMSNPNKLYGEWDEDRDIQYDWEAMYGPGIDS